MTATAVDYEEPTPADLSLTRLESRGFSRCNSGAWAHTTGQPGEHYSEFETHRHSTEGSTWDLPCREHSGTESVIQALHLPAADSPQAVTESALKHKLWAPRIFKSAVPGYCLQGRRMAR